MSSWFLGPPVATTYALKCTLASWMAKWPTPPEPPWISTRAPGLGSPPDCSACAAAGTPAQSSRPP